MKTYVRVVPTGHAYTMPPYILEVEDGGNVRAELYAKLDEMDLLVVDRDGSYIVDGFRPLAPGLDDLTDPII